MRAEVWTWTRPDQPIVVRVDSVYCQGHLCRLLDDTGLEERLALADATPGAMWIYLTGPYAGMVRRVVRYDDSEFMVLDAGVPQTSAEVLYEHQSKVVARWVDKAIKARLWGR